MSDAAPASDAAAPADDFAASPLARDLRDFAGKNADTMLNKMRGWLPPEADPAHAAKQKRHRGGFGSMIWPALFITFIWFFYRRMYLEGAAFIVLPIVLGLLLPNATISGTVPGVIAALLGGMLYWKRAERRIAKADAQGLTGEARSAFLAAGGGVSIPGMIFGIVIFAAMLGLAFAAATMDPNAV